MYVKMRDFLNEQIELENKYYPKIGLYTEDAFNLIEFQESFRNLYPNYPYADDNFFEEVYYYNSKEEAYNKINDILNMFDSLPNPIPIYRTIKVNSLNDIRYNMLGESWSFDKQSAINFAKNQTGGNVLLSAKINSENVDWKRTIKQYFDFSGGFDMDDENEIVIDDEEKIFDIKTEKM